MKAELRMAKSAIHITTDLWSSGNHKSILGVVAHYITDNRKLKHRVIAVRELEGSHAGDNQAAVVAAVISEYEIDKQLGFFIGDNDSKNDTLVEALSDCK